MPDTDNKAQLEQIAAEIRTLRTYAEDVQTQAQQIASDAGSIYTSVTRLDGRVQALKAAMSAPVPTPTPIPAPAPPVPVPVPVPTPTPAPAQPAFTPLATLTSKETSGYARTNTFVSTGVPLPDIPQAKDISLLALMDQTGKPVVADLRPTAWHDNGNVKWVQVGVIDSFKPDETRTYALGYLDKRDVAMQPKPLGISPLLAQGIGDSVVVDTGEYTFTIDVRGLIRSLDSSTGVVAKGSPSVFTFDGTADAFNDKYVRHMEIEYLGPLVCYVVVESVSMRTWGTLSDGKTPARISTTRRYEFVLGRGYAIVESIIKWEGTKNGQNHQMPDGKTLNAVLGTMWKDTITPASPIKGTFVFDLPGQEPLAVHSGTAVALRQSLRTSRKAKREGLLNARNTETLSAATGGVIGLDMGNNSLLVAGLKQMALYEPMALVWQNGNLEIQHASDKFYLAHRQGAFTTCVVGVASSVEQVWADLNKPMRLFADPAHYRKCGHAIPSDPAYLSVTKQVCEITKARIEADGMYGLQTYGWWPRSWDATYLETDDSKPSWDSLYATSAWTDYYSTSRLTVTHALMSSNPDWLEELSFPSARRMLYTQIMQCDPADPWPYAGWAPTGYAAGRSDFNSSHSYYENLFWFHRLTGNRLVLDTITRGEEAQLSALKSQNLAGRFPNQRLRAQRFLSQHHPDPAKRKMFLDAWATNVKRAIDECYVDGLLNGDKTKPVALWVDGKKVKGVNRTPNLYAMSIWDLESLYQYGVFLSETTSTLSPALVVGDKIAKLVRTIQTYGTTLLGGKGTSVTEPWCRAFQFTWDGGTTITNLGNFEAPEEPNMYPGDLPGMCASWARAAKLTGDPAMMAKAKELITYTLDYMTKGKLPLNKLTGLSDSTLADAIVALNS